MFSLIKTIGLKKLLATETPSFLLSLILAETAYKFGSFVLECLAFLVTWGFISYLFNVLLSPRKNPS
ncbi:hypothetical protein [Flavisolibacter ginsenosidimutans]|uniref:Uncharacterized protein n=1 Tax=Flavisolibacter ginsenosidimutans TaxID=661481 RepID=A0A5B8UIL1_9BACT|nr:hypothetical protein [Flavisolibacter ginsenosidimutans]QEC56521.1 hypothetical protein FSB75_11650 [Flavisolibacter ginsenosidimutans]